MLHVANPIIHLHQSHNLEGMNEAIGFLVEDVAHPKPLRHGQSAWARTLSKKNRSVAVVQVYGRRLERMQVLTMSSMHKTDRCGFWLRVRRWWTRWPIPTKRSITSNSSLLYSGWTMEMTLLMSSWSVQNGKRRKEDVNRNNRSYNAPGKRTDALTFLFI